MNDMIVHLNSNQSLKTNEIRTRYQLEDKDP
jgi:hypothetical protein